MSEKSEEPTPRRLQRARAEGDSGASSFASQALAFVVAVAIAPAAVMALVNASQKLLHRAIERAADPEPKLFEPTELAATFLTLVVPILAAAALTASVAQLVQTGGFVATKKLSPKLDRLNVFVGFRELLSTRRLFAVARSLVLGTAVCAFVYFGLRSHAVDLAHLPGQSEYVGIAAGAIVKKIAQGAALVGLAMGVIDIAIERRSWWSRLKMTPREVARERKEHDGDPQLKSARSRAHREIVDAASIGEVRKATVVVHTANGSAACALRYEKEDRAPVVVANGKGMFASAMIDEARAWGIPIATNEAVTRALIEREVGSEIPENEYESVAEIFRELR